MKCPKCESNKIETEDGYLSIFRCFNCNKIGNDTEFMGE